MIAFREKTIAALEHHWKKCICVGRAYELLFKSLQDHLRFLQKEIGYRHIRFHASFHDDVGVVTRRKDGTLKYTWTQLDQIYDFLVEAGFDPIVEINPMPSALASGDKTMFWYKMNITPPRDWAEWQTFVQTVTAHFVERYGMERVKRWYFEVWNEPDLDGFWSGTWDEYMLLYKHAALGVKSVHSGLRVGGPATADSNRPAPFAATCREQGLPLDFLSCHIYPQNEYCEYLMRIQSELLSAHAVPKYDACILKVQDSAVELPMELGRNEVLFAELVVTAERAVVTTERTSLDEQLDVK